MFRLFTVTHIRSTCCADLVSRIKLQRYLLHIPHWFGLKTGIIIDYLFEGVGLHK